MKTLHAFLAVAAFWLVVSPPAAASINDFPKDRDDLLINTFTDPNYPKPAVGERRITARFDIDPAWSDWEWHIRYGRSSSEVAANTSTTPRGPWRDQTTPTQLSGNEYSASFTLPYRRSRLPGNCNTTAASGHDVFYDGETVFYRWELHYKTTPGGAWTIVNGDVHTFTMPRRMMIGIVGDSYGSGEGAPCSTANPWVTDLQGVAGRRSAVSGQNLAAAEFVMTNRGLAVELINVSSSGAIAEDIYSNVSQRTRDSKGGISKPQLTMLHEEMVRRTRSPKPPGQTRVPPALQHVDMLILSAGGNDMGFAKIVAYYLGVDLIQVIAAAAPCLLATLPGILTLNPIAIGIAYLCIFAQQVSLPPYSVRIPYDAGHVSQGGPKSFDWHGNRLLGEYSRLATALKNGRQVAPGVTSKFHNVAATSYPNPLLNCRAFYDTFSVLKIKGIVDLPLIHLSAFIDPLEAAEIANVLAPPLTRPKPRGGGLNHLVRTGVNNAQAASPDTDWKLVRTEDYQVSSSGVCFNNRDFNRLSDAQDMPGDKKLRESHAFHPNRTGHARIYYRALRDHLSGNLTDAYRIARAKAEHLDRPTQPHVDIALDGRVEITSFDPVTRQVDYTATVKNHGTLVSAATTIEFSLDAGIGVVATANVPSVSAGASHVLTGSFTIADQPQFQNHRFICPDVGWPIPGFAFYAERDTLLAHLFPVIYNLSARIDPSDAIAESNEVNNRAAADDTFEIGPPMDPARVAAILADLANAIGGFGNNFDLSVLRRSDALVFFGYYSYEVSWLLENGPAPDTLAMANLIKSYNFYITHQTGQSEETDAAYRIRNGLRPICLWPEDDTFAELPEKTTGGLVRVYNPAALDENLPRDGRLGDLRFNLGAETYRPTFPRDPGDPPVPGIGNLPEEGTINDDSFAFDLNPAVGYTSASLAIGTHPESRDVFSGDLPDIGAGGTFSTSGLPQDGRTLFATLTSTRPDGSTSTEHYQFATDAANARLSIPAPGAALSANTRLEWAPGNVQADGYRVRVGSTRGASDLYPGSDPDPPLGFVAKSKPKKGDKDDHEPPTIPAGTTFIDLDALPSDGRDIHVTLSSLRGGTWHDEHYRYEAAERDDARLAFPPPGTPLGASVLAVIAPGDDSEFHRVSVGREPGLADLFDSFDIPADVTDLPVFLPPPDTGEVFVNVTTIRAGNPVTHTTPYPRAQHATLVFPDAFFRNLNPNAPPLEPTTFFVWDLPFGEVQDVTLRVLDPEQPLPLFEQAFAPPLQDAQVDLSVLQPGRPFVVELATRFFGQETPVSESYLFLAPGGPEVDYALDEIDDFWQVIHFGPDNPDALPGADPDGDGDDNDSESKSGSHPLDPGSFFQPLTQLHRTPGEGGGEDAHLLLSIPELVPGTRYQWYQSLDLNEWFPVGEPIVLGPESTETQHELFFPLPSGPSLFPGFFRVGLEREPFDPFGGLPPGD